MPPLRNGSSMYLNGSGKRAKSPKEKMKRYRAKMSEEKREIIKERDRIRKAAAREKMPESVKIANREKSRLAMRQLRNIRKCSLQSTPQTSPDPTSQSLVTTIKIEPEDEIPDCNSKSKVPFVRLSEVCGFETNKEEESEMILP